MEYNKTKRGLEKASAILGIISAILGLIGALALVVAAILYLSGEMDFMLLIGYDTYGYPIYDYIDYSYLGWDYLILALFVLPGSILMLIFSIKLVKSPFLPNGELKNKKAARVWLLVLALLNGNLIIAGLMIAVLCLKDFKEPVAVKPNNNQQYVSKVPMNNSNEYLEFYGKIQEVKNLKNLGIIDDVTFKKAIAKIVTDIAK